MPRPYRSSGEGSGSIYQVGMLTWLLMEGRALSVIVLSSGMQLSRLTAHLSSCLALRVDIPTPHQPPMEYAKSADHLYRSGEASLNLELVRNRVVYLGQDFDNPLAFPLVPGTSDSSIEAINTVHFPAETLASVNTLEPCTSPSLPPPRRPARPSSDISSPTLAAQRSEASTET